MEACDWLVGQNTLVTSVTSLSCKSTILEIIVNKKAVLSQRLPRDAPYLYNKKIPK